MLTLVLRRARVQGRLLVAVVVLVAAAASLLGVCSLLLTRTQDRAFAVTVDRASAADVDVTAYLVDLQGRDLPAVRAQAESVVRGVLGPLRPTVTSTATSRMRGLSGHDGLGYLASDGALSDRAALTSGRWPRPASGRWLEAALPERAATLLGVRAGSRLTLGTETGVGGAERPVRVVVVGTFEPRSRAAWESDPLSGEGYDPAYSDGSVTAPAYGPLVVTDDALLATGSSITGARVVAHPTLSRATDARLRAAAAALDGASPLLASRTAGRVQITRVGSDLGTTLDRIHAQQSAARATVLVVLLLGAALALAATVLAGRLVATTREDERALLVALGLSPRQQLVTALLEAVLVAAAAVVVAVPVAAVTHARLTRLPAFADAGLAQGVAVTWDVVLPVLAGALALALALVAVALDRRTAAVPTGPRWTAARAGADGLLVALAAAGWWQLRSQSDASTPGDLTLAVAPVVTVAALAVLGVRVVPLLLSGCARLAERGRGLVPALAAAQAARRPHAGTAMVLSAAAVATAVLGLGLRTTWVASQHDQAALRVGTDLSLTPVATPDAADAAAVAAAVRAGSTSAVLSPVVDRPLALGSFVGAGGTPPVLVAVDTRHAGALLRGRLEPGRTWAGVGAGLAPAAAPRGPSLPSGGAGVELVGSAGPGVALTASVTALLQDAHGFRSTVPAAPAVLDGRPHRLRWRGQVGRGTELVGVRLRLDAAPGGTRAVGTTQVSVTLRVPGGGAAGTPWPVHALQRQSPVRGATAALAADGGRALVRTTVGLDLAYFAYTGADVLATAFAPPADVPVVVSQTLLDATGAKVGGRLSALVGDVAVPLRVTGVVPSVPAAPGRPAVLADVDTVSRAVLAAGSASSPVDAWWVGHPGAGTARALTALGLGDVGTRTGTTTALVRGPLRVTVPTALVVLVAAGAVLLLAGVALVLSGDRSRRLVEVARLRALGLTRGQAGRVVLAEHLAFFVPLVVVGAVVGGVCVVTIGPDLVRSDLGTAPVPAPLVAWAWGDQALLVGGLLLAVGALITVVTVVQVTRARPAYLRGGEG